MSRISQSLERIVIVPGQRHGVGDPITEIDVEYDRNSLDGVSRLSTNLHLTFAQSVEPTKSGLGIVDHVLTGVQNQQVVALLNDGHIVGRNVQKSGYDDVSAIDLFSMTEKTTLTLILRIWLSKYFVHGRFFAEIEQVDTGQNSEPTVSSESSESTVANDKDPVFRVFHHQGRALADLSRCKSQNVDRFGNVKALNEPMSPAKVPVVSWIYGQNWTTFVGIDTELTGLDFTAKQGVRTLVTDKVIVVSVPHAAIEVLNGFHHAPTVEFDKVRVTFDRFGNAPVVETEFRQGRTVYRLFDNALQSFDGLFSFGHFERLM